MTAPILSSGLLTSALLLLTACTIDVGRSAASASATEGRSPPWAVTLQRQSSIAGSGLHEIDESDLRSGDLLFSSSLGITSLGIRAFSASSVSHVALYLGEGQIAEATGAGVQVISVQQALAHSDKNHRIPSQSIAKIAVNDSVSVSVNVNDITSTKVDVVDKEKLNRDTNGQNGKKIHYAIHFI